PRVLRHRDDGRRHAALRPGPVRHGALRRDPAAGGPDDRRRPGEQQDGPRRASGLRPDGQPEVGHLHGCLRQLGRHVQQLRDRPGRRPHHPGRHLPARLSAAAGDAAGLDPHAARAGPEHPPRRQPGRRRACGREGGPRGRPDRAAGADPRPRVPPRKEPAGMSEEKQPAEDERATDVERPRPEGVHPQGPGLGGTANTGYPSTEGLSGGNRPVEYTNVGGSPEGGEVDPEHAAVVRGERRGMFGARAGQDTSGYGGLKKPIAYPGAAARPYGGWYDEVVDRLTETTGTDLVERVVVHADELTLHVDRENLVPVMRALRDQADLRFEMCVSVSGVHFLEDEGAELHVAYHL